MLKSKIEKVFNIFEYKIRRDEMIIKLKVFVIVSMALALFVGTFFPNYTTGYASTVASTESTVVQEGDVFPTNHHYSNNRVHFLKKKQ